MIEMDFTNIIAIASLVTLLAVVAWSLQTRWKFQQEIINLKRDQAIINNATYGLASQLRKLQLASRDEGRDSNRAGSISSTTLQQADKLVDQGLDTLGLADQLGLSQNEAEIITHLRPVRHRVA